MVKCPRCNGTGRSYNPGLSFFGDRYSECGYCGGSGRVERHQTKRIPTEKQALESQAAFLGQLAKQAGRAARKKR